jgi:hypothetical protein
MRSDEVWEVVVLLLWLLLFDPKTNLLLDLVKVVVATSDALLLIEVSESEKLSDELIKGNLVPE